MAQWTDFQQIEKFENPTLLYVTGGLYLVKLGLTVGWQTKFGRGLDIIKACCRLKYSIFCFFSQGTALFQQL